MIHFGGIFFLPDQNPSAKAPKKVKLTEQSQSNTSNESPVGQIVSKCANQSEERTDKDVH